MNAQIKKTSKNQKGLYFKIGFILLLVLLLMIPNLLIQDLILERQSLEQNVQSEIASNWGPDQHIMGPILSIPYTIEVDFDDKVKEEQHILRVVPSNIDITVDVTTEERKKSIYKAILYNARHKLKGSFTIPNNAEFGNYLKEIHWDQAVIDIGFSSAASLDDIVNINWDNDIVKMESGASSGGLFGSAIHANINIDPSKKEYEFASNFGINGSKSLNYLPLAGNTTVKMNSSWNAPGFTGLPLPQSRSITDDGFSAEWKATEYNRPFKNAWVDNEVKIFQHKANFGVDLVQVVGHYQKNMRSAKYALLIISLSFLIFFFFEILKGSKIHPVQYIFVGLSLSVFYVLLLSLSEHFGFNWSYLVASTGTVGLISWYSKFLLKRESNVTILTLILICLYAYIFTLLQMEEFALLVGSLGLFTALVITMYLSKDTDWYSLGSSKKVFKPEGDLIVQ